MLAEEKIKLQSGQRTNLQIEPQDALDLALAQIEAVIKEEQRAKKIWRTAEEESEIRRPADRTQLRKTGIALIGEVPWGTHFCQFYQTKEDLIEILVPYFKTGLENNEFCMWVTSEPLDVECARESLQKEVKDLDGYIEKGQIEIIDYRSWYTRLGYFNAENVLQGWAEKEKLALEKGFEGLRLTGNTFWLETKDWEEFTKYEAVVNSIIAKHRMLAICAYCLDKCSGSQIIDVVNNHQFACIRRDGKWSFVESSDFKKTRKALWQTEERHRTLLETIPDGIQKVDTSGRIIFANKALHKIYGCPDGELLGKSVFDFPVSEAEKTRLRRYLTDLSKGQFLPMPYESKVLTKDSRVIDVLVHWNYRRDESGQITGFVSIVSDITENKKAENELLFKTALLEAQSETSIDGILVVNSDGKSILHNKRFGQMWNIPDELLGTKNDEKMIQHVIDQLEEPEKFLERVRYLYAHKEEKSTDEIRFKDGKIFRRYSSPLVDSEGTYHGRIWYFRDVTDQKKAEQEILRFNQELENRVEKRTAKLTRTHLELLREAARRKQVEDKLRREIEERKCLEKELLEISEREKRLIGEELHDSIGQQFLGIAFMAKLLEQKLAVSLPKKAAVAAEITRLVNQAMVQTRDLARGLHAIDLNATNLITALQELAANTTHLFDIRCTFSHNRPIPINDKETAVHLYRITQEAVTNAIKHSRAKNILIKLTRGKNKSVLMIKSDGMGFPEGGGRNNGMGLRIMNHRVEMIGGSLDIHNGAGSGTILTCVFPHQKGQQSAERIYDAQKIAR
jgi:PAS domain S-box-containing protein